MAAITSAVEVDRPAADVYDYATDPSRFHEWQKGVVDGRVGSAGAAVSAGGAGESRPEKVGDRCVTVRRIGFANRPITSEITHLDPPRHWSIRGLDGPIRARVDVAVDVITDCRSLLTITLDFEGHGPGRLLVPLVVVPGARKEMPANLENLRRRLESDGAQR